MRGRRALFLAVALMGISACTWFTAPDWCARGMTITKTDTLVLVSGTDTLIGTAAYWWYFAPASCDTINRDSLRAAGWRVNPGFHPEDG